jgi:hypothetical protein
MGSHSNTYLNNTTAYPYAASNPIRLHSVKDVIGGLVASIRRRERSLNGSAVTDDFTCGMDVVFPPDTNEVVAHHPQHKQLQSVEELRSEATGSHAAAQAIFEEAKKLPAQGAASSRAHCAAPLANERKKLEFLCNFWFELQELGIVKELTDAAH